MPDAEADPILKAELQAEVLRLCAKVDGPAPIEAIYAEHASAGDRREAVLDLSLKRVSTAVQKLKRGGVCELTVICFPWRVDLELCWAAHMDGLRDSPTSAQAWINLHLMGERTTPNGHVPPNPNDDVAWVDP